MSDRLSTLLAGSLGRPFDVLCLGLNATDHLCLASSFPERGGKTRMSALTTSGGGQAATAACALGRLGWRVVYAGVCGDDQAGQRVEPLLKEFGVEPLGLVVKPGTRSQQAFIMVEEGGGERTIVWYRDEECRLSPEDLRPEMVVNSRVLHLDGHFIEASLAAARLARQHGVLVSLDGERVFPGTRQLVAMCDVVVGCQDFAQRLLEIGEPARALRELAKLGPAWVGRTLGHEGAELLVEGMSLRCPGLPVQAVDTTGAGDVFHAGLVHAILAGQEPGPALRTACALAAISVTGLGGRSALADAATLEAFLANHPA